jgi:hypothetical protein
MPSAERNTGLDPACPATYRGRSQWLNPNRTLTALGSWRLYAELVPAVNMASVELSTEDLVTAAGIHKVALFDRTAEILHLQSGSSRLLHTHIYEWPQFGSLC